MHFKLLPALLGLTTVCSGAAIFRRTDGGQDASWTMPAPTVGNFTTSDESLISYRLYNNATRQDATPVIFIGGLLQVQDDWKGVLPYFAKDRPVVTFDNRGMGESTVKNQSVVTVNNMMSDLQTLIQHFGWNRVDLVGVSTGATVAEYFTSNFTYGDLRVEHLVLVSSAYKYSNVSPLASNITQWIDQMDKPPTGEQWTSFQEKLFWASLTPEYIQKNPEQTRIFTQDFKGNSARSYDAYNAQSNAWGQYDLTEDLKRIDTKTLVLHGAKDLLSPVKNGREIHALIKGSKYVEYADGGHLLYITNPEAIKETATFLNGE